MSQKKKIQLSLFTDRVRIDAFDDVIVKVYLQKQQNDKKVFLVGGTDPKVGASTVAKHLAAGLAKTGKKTLLLDTDMRKGKKEKYEEEEFSFGLEQYLSKDMNLEEVVYSTNVELLDMIPADKSTVSVQLLCSEKLEELFQKLREEYEYIIVDIPSFGAVSDGSAILGSVDQVILVAAPCKSYKKQILECYDMVKKYGTELLGVVVNRVDKYGYHDYRKNAKYYEGSEKDILGKYRKFIKKNEKNEQ